MEAGWGGASIGGWDAAHLGSWQRFLRCAFFAALHILLRLHAFSPQLTHTNLVSELDSRRISMLREKNLPPRVELGINDNPFPINSDCMRPGSVH